MPPHTATACLRKPATGSFAADTGAEQFVSTPDSGASLFTTYLLELGTPYHGAYLYGRRAAAFHSRLRCVLDSDGVASARIYAAKLEVGDHQTLAAVDANGDWQLLEQPDPLEYLKCYRYQFIPWIGDNSYPLGTGFAMGTTSARIIIPCPVRMRMESPEMGFLDGTSWSGLSIFNNGTARPPTGISGVKSTPTGIGINLVTSGLVGNRSCVLRRTDARIIFDANL